MQEMISLFDIADVNASASTFNPEKLDWLNQHYISTMPADELAPLLSEQLERIGVAAGDGPALEAVIEAYRERAITMKAMAEDCKYLFVDHVTTDPGAAKKHLRPVVLAPMQTLRAKLESLPDWQSAALSAAVEQVAAEHEINMGKLGQPTRVAVTGRAASPGLDVTLALIGRERALTRLDAAIAMIEARAAAQ